MGQFSNLPADLMSFIDFLEQFREICVQKDAEGERNTVSSVFNINGQGARFRSLDYRDLYSFSKQPRQTRLPRTFGPAVFSFFISLWIDAAEIGYQTLRAT